jgi:hypothetical protein
MLQAHSSPSSAPKVGLDRGSLWIVTRFKALDSRKSNLISVLDEVTLDAIKLHIPV